MNLSFKVGSAFGIPVRLHFTMLLLPLISWNWMPISGFLGMIAWVGLVVLLFGSVLLHELGHALVARRYGVRTKDIVLTPIGGMARVIDMPRSPRHEIAIAIAGPLVSLSLAGLSFLGTFIMALAFPLPGAVKLGMGLLMQINLMLGLFNLIPALPMDGGRVLRGYLALKMDFLKATRVAARVGRVIAVAGGVLAIFWFGSWTLALIAGFIYFSAGSEVRMAEWRAYQEQARAAARAAPPGPFGPFTPGTERRVWTWETPRPAAQASWSDPAARPVDPRDVVVVQGKAEVISRADPDKTE